MLYLASILIIIIIIIIVTLVNLVRYFGMFEESPQLSTSGSARLLVTIQSNKLLLLAAM